MLDWVPAVPRRPHLPPQIRLPRLRNSVSGASARASDRRRPGDAGTARAGPGQQILRSHAAVPAVANLCASRRRSRSLDAGRMGRRRMLVARRAVRKAVHQCLCVGSSVCRRHAGAGARSGRGRTKTGRLWVYARDQRPWGGLAAPAAIFVFAPDRKSERPAAHLKNFSGILHVDSYAGFARLQAHGDITLAACWVHMRRNFHEFYEATNSPVAAEALRRIGELYTIEERIRGQSPALRLAERRTFSKPLAEKLTIHPVPLPRSTTPGRIDDPCLLSVSSMLPPLRRQRRLQRHGYIGAIAGLQHLLPTLQEWCCHHPCKARFRPAGSPLPGGS